MRLILLLILLLAAACGGTTDNGDTDNGGDTDPTAPVAPTNATPNEFDLTATALSEQATESGAPTAASTLSDTQRTATALIREATESAGGPTETCETGTNTATDPDAQAALQDALPNATNIQVLVTTDQPDCDTLNVLNAFAQITLPADSLADAPLGNVTANAIGELNDVDVPEPVTYTLVFESGGEQRELMFNGDQISELMDLRGAALIEAIEG